jgi:hypothetical protein
MDRRSDNADRAYELEAQDPTLRNSGKQGRILQPPAATISVACSGLRETASYIHVVKSGEDYDTDVHFYGLLKEPFLPPIPSPRKL